MEISVCEENDIDELAAAAGLIWREYFPALIGAEQTEYMIEKYQSAPALRDALKNGYTYFLARENGGLIGYCGVKPEGELLFLSKLYLKREFRGKGLSSRLLKRAEDFARDGGLKGIYLTCNKRNRHSLDVYRAKGFYQTDSVVTDIGNGFVMDDYIMRLDLRNH